MAEGSLKKEKNGTYTIVVDVGKNGERKQKKKRGFKTKKEAQEAINKILSEVNEGSYIEPVKLTLGSYMTEWLETKTGNMTRLTIDSYRSYIKNHIEPSIGKIPLSKLTSFDIQKMVNDLRNKRGDSGEPLLSDSTVQRIFNIVITALNNAKKLQLIRENVAKLVDKPRIKRKKLEVWDIEDIQTFLDYMYDKRHYICFHLALTTGMRQGEILGLTWSAIDFEKKLIHVTQTLSHDGKEINQGAKSQSGVRSISINDKDVEELQRHLARIQEEKETVEELYEDQGFVVCTRVGRPVFAYTVGWMFRETIKKLNLRPIRFHDLRHTHASILLKQGVHPKVVSERLGHSSITITLDTYSHLLPNMQEDAAKGLGELLFSKDRALDENT